MGVLTLAPVITDKFSVSMYVVPSMIVLSPCILASSSRAARSRKRAERRKPDAISSVSTGRFCDVLDRVIGVLDDDKPPSLVASGAESDCTPPPPELEPPTRGGANKEAGTRG